VNRILFYRAW